MCTASSGSLKQTRLREASSIRRIMLGKKGTPAVLFDEGKLRVEVVVPQSPLDGRFPNEPKFIELNFLRYAQPVHKFFIGLQCSIIDGI
jgi:hypothetical protein